MRLYTRPITNCRIYTTNPFRWRWVARYHLGVQALRWLKAVDECRDLLGDLIEMAVNGRLKHEIAECCALDRSSRLFNSWGGLVFSACLAIPLLSCTLAEILLTKSGQQISVVFTPMPLAEEIAKSEPNEVAAEISVAASFSEPVEITVDPASRLKLEYAQAREQCLVRLEELPSYQSTRTEVAALQKEVDALRSEDPHGELPGVSLRWIRAKSVLAGMTQSAIVADPAVQQAERAMRAGGLIQPTFPIRSNQRVEGAANSSQTSASE